MTTAMETLADHKISSVLDENDALLKRVLGIGVSWDLIAKPFVFGGVRMTAYTANGYFLTMNMVLIVENVEMTIKEFVERHHGQFTLEELVNYLNLTIGFVQVTLVTTLKDAVRYILSGPLVIFFDGFDRVLMVDTRIYPMRSIEEPELERVVRGPRDGFVETMLMNVALIRRRLRDPRLRVELLQIGTRSQTDVSLLYLEDVTNDEFVRQFRDGLRSIQMDIVAMGEQAVTESLGRVKWNPYPIVRYTERPDVAATSLLEGQVVVVVDTTPEVIIGPTTLFHHLHHPEDYHMYPLNGTYMRLVQILGAAVSVFSPAVFILLAAEHHLLPKSLSFLGVPKRLPVPLGLQFLVAQLVVDLFERAVINTPTTLATAIGVLAALVFGQFAVMMDLVTPEVLVYMGAAVVAQFATSSHELSTANRLSRLFLIIATWIFGGAGFAAATAVLIFLLASTRSFGVPYLWPVLPFDWLGFKNLILRRPLYEYQTRSTILRAKTDERRG